MDFDSYGSPDELLLKVINGLRLGALQDSALKTRIINNKTDVLPSVIIDPNIRQALPSNIVVKAEEESSTQMYLVIPFYWGSAAGTPYKTMEFYQKLMIDSNFRSDVVADAKGEIESFFSITLPGNLAVTVKQETATTRWLILPHDFSDTITGSGIDVYSHAERAKGWKTGPKPKKTSLINWCKPDDRTTDPTDPYCEPVEKTYVTTDPDCPSQPCSPTWTYGT